MKKNNLQLVTTTIDPLMEISDSIRAGTWSNIATDVDLKEFLVEPTPKKYNINVNKSLQVRLTTLNWSFINKQVNKVKNTGDKTGLKMPVLVFFPDKVEYEDTVFAANSFALLDRNHGVLIRANCGIFNSDCYVVNFDDDLDSKLSNIRALGNLLNFVWEETQSTELENIKAEYHQLMDERDAAGLDPSPTKEENDLFKSRYPILGDGSIRNFVGSHKTGKRKKPAWMPSDADKFNWTTNITKRYPDWLVMSPRTLASFKGEPSGQATWDALTNPLPINKIVFIFYASTIAQEEKEYQHNIKTLFKAWGQRYGFKTKVIIMNPFGPASVGSMNN